MKISTKGRYALEAVLDLTYYGRGELENLKNVSERLAISKNYLEQIFGTLRAQGIVISVRGAYGGYRLAKPPEEVTVGEILRAMEGSLSPVPCLDDGKCTQPCDQFNMCVTREVWARMATEIDRVIDGKTIAALIEAYDKLQRKDTYEFMI